MHKQIKIGLLTVTVIMIINYTFAIAMTIEKCNQNYDDQFSDSDIILLQNYKGLTQPGCDLNGEEDINNKNIKLFREGHQSQSDGKIPDTGQTQSYTHTFGEDSDYLINPPSYTDNGDGTVTDNVTGLMWQQADNGIRYTYRLALNYCYHLTLAGYVDWRLPSLWELFTIVNYGAFNPAIDSKAFQCNSSSYWTATPCSADPARSTWGVDFSYGYTVGYMTSPYICMAWGVCDSLNVRCVRSER